MGFDEVISEHLKFALAFNLGATLEPKNISEIQELVTLIQYCIKY